MFASRLLPLTHPFRSVVLPTAYRAAFYRYWLLQVCERARSIFWIVLMLCTYLFAFDWLRWTEGTLLTKLSYRYLFYAHFLLLVHVPLIGWIIYKLPAIRAGEYPRIWIWLGLGSFLFHVYTAAHAILAYWDRGTMVAYGLLLGAYHLLIVWSGWIRLVSIGVSALKMSIAIVLLPPPAAQERLLVFGELLGISVLIFAVSTHFYNSLIREFLQTQQLQQHADQLRQYARELEVKNSLVSDELNQRTRELTSYTLHELAQHRFLEQLGESIRSADRPELDQIPKRIESHLQGDARWGHFRLLFEQVHPQFWERVTKIYPDLSSYELKLVALLRMNLSTKEIADVLGISPQSANTSRYRLRKKLRLQPNQDLEAFVRTL
jgi:DNA-binding CsgD family transcriptional regulator